MHFNRLFYICFIAVLLSCNSKNGKKQEAHADTSATIAANQLIHTTAAILDTTSQQDVQYETFYIAMASVGNDYYTLDKEMYEINSSTPIPVDTLGRYYDTKKKEIVEPQDSDDEMYQGEYYPRRFNGIFLSVEQLSSFQEKRSPYKFGLMAAICYTQQQADSVLDIIKPFAPKSYVMPASLYVGCMH